jgi:hypothetical protein
LENDLRGRLPVSRQPALQTGGRAPRPIHFRACTPGRPKTGDDVFTLDRLIDAAANIGISVRMTVTRLYRQA